MNLIRLIAGALALTMGRRLFWFFVGLAGFALGTTLAARFLESQPTWLVLVIALGAGILGSILAVFAQQLAVGIAGFAAGGYTAFAVLDAMALSLGRLEWVLAVITGVLGLVLALALFDWALIILSALIGAGLVVQGLELGRPWGIFLFLALAAAGIAIQLATRPRAEPEK